MALSRLFNVTVGWLLGVEEDSTQGAAPLSEEQLRMVEEIFRRYQQQLTGREAVKLPSTSPANAAWSAERLTAAWRVILEALK